MVKDATLPNAAPSPTNSNFVAPNFIKRAFESRGNKTSNVQQVYRALGSPEVHRIVLLSSMYHTAMNTFSQLRLDILTGNNSNISSILSLITWYTRVGLCYQGEVLYNMWLFLCSLGPTCGLRTFLDRSKSCSTCA